MTADKRLFMFCACPAVPFSFFSNLKGVERVDRLKVGETCEIGYGGKIKTVKRLNDRGFKPLKGIKNGR